MSGAVMGVVGTIEGIDACIFQGQVELLDEFFAESRGRTDRSWRRLSFPFRGESGRHRRNRRRERETIRPVGDSEWLRPRRFGFRRLRFRSKAKREISLNVTLCFVKSMKSFFEDGVDIVGNNVEEKILGNAEREFCEVWRKILRGAETGFAFHAGEDWFEK